MSFEFLSDRIYQSDKLSKVNKLIKLFGNFCFPLVVEKKNEGNKKDNKILSYIKESIIFSVIKDMKKILYCIYSNYSDLNEFFRILPNYERF